MAELSDQLLVVAIFTYLAAMICHAVEYALGDRSGGATVAVRQPALVAASAVDTTPGGTAVSPSATGSGQEPGDGRVGSRPTTDVTPGRGLRAVPAGLAAVAVTVLAVVVHLSVLVTRGVAADRMPWGNLYEFVLSVTFVGAVAWLVVLRQRPGVRRLGLFLTLTMVLLLGIAGMVLYVPVVPLIPALNSYWFVIHVSTVVLASGVLLLGFVPAVMYLLRAGHEQGKRSFPYTLARRGPTAPTLERLTFGLHAFAFPLFTFGVIAGAIWAEAAWGRPWGWDPKETWSFISWVIYAGYLHARATPSIKRSTATWIAVLGFLTVLMNLFGVNIFFEGFHSYGGLD